MALTLSGSGAINGLTLPTDSLQPGAVLVASQSFSGASSVSINNCFTSTYQNYLIHWSITPSGSTDIAYRMRAAGVDASGTGTYAFTYIYANNTTASATAGVAAYGPTDNTASGSRLVSMTMMNPALVANTDVLTLWYTKGASGGFCGTQHATALAYDGISVFPGAGGTITGNIRIYGMRNS